MLRKNEWKPHKVGAKGGEVVDKIVFFTQGNSYRNIKEHPPLVFFKEPNGSCSPLRHQGLKLSTLFDREQHLSSL